MSAPAWWLPAADSELLYHEAAALMFLRSFGPHCVGTITNEDELAAVIVFEGLKHRACVIAEIGENGPIYRITPKGVDALGSQPGAA